MTFQTEMTDLRVEILSKHRASFFKTIDCGTILIFVVKQTLDFCFSAETRIFINTEAPLVQYLHPGLTF